MPGPQNADLASGSYYLDNWLGAKTPADTTPATNGPQNADLVPDPNTYGGNISHLAAPGDVGGAPPDTPPADDQGTFNPDVDYSTMFDFFGLPADIKAHIQTLIAQAQGDVSQATPLVLAYVRGTDWYAKTYPGIQYGLASGQFGSNPEMDYRQYVNSANQYYNQYLSRAVATDEIVNALKEGVDVSVLGKRLEGQSFANANSNEWQYELGAFGEGRQDEAGITALGRESVGLNSSLGDKLQVQLDKAHAKMMNLFQGTLASPNLQKTAQGGLATNSNVKPDIGA